MSDLFADSITPDSIPAEFTRVAAYYNGAYAWPREALARLTGGHILISVTGDPDAAEAARCIDVERWDATPEQSPEFVGARFGCGHRDALIYCSLATVPAVLHFNSPTDLHPWRLWLADWTPDGRPPTRADLVDRLHAQYGVTVPAWRIWGCQYASLGSYDASVLYAPDDFTRP